ncbi:alpha-amylase [Actinobacillus succinogenes]|uniref:Alpha amylase catalytic region n=1 Tax=Actinobacillus succinogenes (strain ATCC 55618 / DSM 22257 / CCUG 43843 / 130Z) TaxID=339671 RepID=A6VL46_ACTSZ|nr:alpha-amylase [Actinobacillus succinogenes]ABR73693.1 alpha amylase catalytic region [Actinobacillus succinogenes 130Z]PHI39849.1 alpha-amylase [Actinobacillus succinogenes]
MKKSLLYFCLFTSSVSFAQGWQHTHFRYFNDSAETNLFQSQTALEKGYYPLTFIFDNQCYQPQSAMKLNQTVSLIPCFGEAPHIRLFRRGNYIAQIDMRSGTPTLKIGVQQQQSSDKNALKSCPRWNKQPIEIDVSSTFAEGESVRDFYSNQIAEVKNGKVIMMPAANADGLILLEKSAVEKTDVFDWKNATVYFVLTDRFHNGNPANDNSYGRHKDGMQEIGTFHGGDLQGLTEKLDYLQQLGVNALWISSPLEQMHGWVGGGNKGDFPHYGYHGYYHLDWTKLDANMGTESDLRNLIQQAHRRGIRVLFDIVMNHTGYATLADMQEFKFGDFYLKPEEITAVLGEKWTNWQPEKGQNWHSFNDFIKFGDSKAWQNWWGKDWVRADIGDYDSPKFDDLRMSLSALPDLKTESESAVELPRFFQHKNTNAKKLDNAKVRDYLIVWLTDWVRRYGVDGFRVDTAKHVEKSTWLALKQASQRALKEWQQKNPKESFGDDFWMTGEAWGHGVFKSDYYQNGFDAMINFDFQDQAKNALDCFARIEPVYQEMNNKLKDFNVLSYLSSHDTRLFFHSDSERNVAKQKIAANLLLLSSGAVQIYYGDESGREFGATGSDPVQGTRSDMNWTDLQKDRSKQALHQHWQKLAQFRQRHQAVGAGVHQTLKSESYFAFSRTLGEDKVMVVWAGN